MLIAPRPLRRNLLVLAACLALILGLLFLYCRDSGRISVRDPVFVSRRVFLPMEGSGADFKMGEVEEGKEPEESRISKVMLEEKLVHLDLKGMPPNVKYFEVLFPFLKKLGVSGILMEYEDMFPYTGRLEAISNLKAYSKQEVGRILEIARNVGLEVVPLIQTFGHLEFMLKLEEFQNLREVPQYMQVVCPTKPDTLSVIKEMIDQVMTLHSGVKRFHIGSDEVYHIGVCPLCMERMNKFRIGTAELFLEHVKAVAQYVKDKHKVKPMMWDDEFRRLDESVIKTSGLGELVEIVIWNYSIDVENRLSLDVWEKYGKIFGKVWIASAFKGANSPNSVAVNESLYLTNHFSWIKTLSAVGNLVQVRGIVLTGWQRYDHFSVLCETLPSAIPSLTACMTLLISPGVPSLETVLRNTSALLDCRGILNVCKFPGSSIHQEILQLEHTKERLKKLQERSVFLGWVQDYNLRTAFSSPSHVEPVYQEISAILMDMQKSQELLGKAMLEFFPKWTVDEWLDTHFYPFHRQTNKLYSMTERILQQNTFPRRPLVANNETSTEQTSKKKRTEPSS